MAEGTAELVRRALGEDIELDFQDFEARDSDVAFNKQGILRDIGRRHGLVKKKLRSYDLIIDTGAGDSFSDIYGIKRQMLMFYVHMLASRFRIPLILGPQTIGPFRSRLSKVMAKSSLSCASSVLSRDSLSWDAAREAGRTPDCDSTDVVFILPRPARRLDRDIVLNVSGLLWVENRHVDSVRYRDWILNFISESKRRGRQVAVMAHVLDNFSSDNDVPAVAHIDGLFGDGVECIVPTTLSQARAVVASAKIVVGSRMHACLNALSVGTPSIAWAYSRKFSPLMNDLGWKHVVDLRSSADPVTETFAILDSTSNAALEVELDEALIRTADRLAKAVLEIQRAVAVDPRLSWSIG